MMKKINLVYALLVILAACGGKSTPSTRISGEIKGLGNDTLYLFGADPLYDRMDTLPVKEGKFSADLSVDTLVTAYLLFSDGNRYPIFVGKGDNILVKGNAGDLTSIEVTGNTANDEFTTFQKDLKGLGNPRKGHCKKKRRHSSQPTRRRWSASICSNNISSRPRNPTCTASNASSAE